MPETSNLITWIILLLMSYMAVIIITNDYNWLIHGVFKNKILLCKDREKCSTKGTIISVSFIIILIFSLSIVDYYLNPYTAEDWLNDINIDIKGELNITYVELQTSNISYLLKGFWYSFYLRHWLNKSLDVFYINITSDFIKRLEFDFDNLEKWKDDNGYVINDKIPISILNYTFLEFNFRRLYKIRIWEGAFGSENYESVGIGSHSGVKQIEIYCFEYIYINEVK